MKPRMDKSRHAQLFVVLRENKEVPTDSTVIGMYRTFRHAEGDAKALTVFPYVAYVKPVVRPEEFQEA